MTKRTEILTEADNLTHGDRQKDYGTPRESFGAIAKMWSAYLGYEVSPADVCHLMSLLKIARLRNGPHVDSSVDACGYMALGGELGDEDF